MLIGPYWVGPSVSSSSKKGAVDGEVDKVSVSTLDAKIAAAETLIKEKKLADLMLKVEQLNNTDKTAAF